MLFTSALAGTIVSASFLPEIPSAATLGYSARRQVANSSSPSFNGPYSTRGRDIVDVNGEKTTWAGVNWPMSGM